MFLSSLVLQLAVADVVAGVDDTRVRVVAAVDAVVARNAVLRLQEVVTGLVRVAGSAGCCADEVVALAAVQLVVLIVPRDVVVVGLALDGVGPVVATEA